MGNLSENLEKKKNNLLCIVNERAVLAYMPHVNQVDVKLQCLKTILTKNEMALLNQGIMAEKVGLMPYKDVIHYRKVKGFSTEGTWMCIHFELLKTDTDMFPDKAVFLSSEDWDKV